MAKKQKAAPKPGIDELEESLRALVLEATAKIFERTVRNQGFRDTEWYALGDNPNAREMPPFFEEALSFVPRAAGKRKAIVKAFNAAFKEDNLD